MESALRASAYVCVRSNGLYFWLPMDRLLYIIPGSMLRAARMEQDPAAALLDGHRIGIFSLRALLGCAGADEEQHAMILKTESGLSGLLVDEVTDTANAGQITFLPLPDAVKSAENTFLQGLVWMESHKTLAYVLDPEPLLEIARKEAGHTI